MMLFFLLGITVGRFLYGDATTFNDGTVVEIIRSGAAANQHQNISAASSSSSTVPQVFNFIKELQCRSGHMDVPSVLRQNGTGKVVVDIGLDAGKEFFAALESGYSVFGFEANPISCIALRKKCETATGYKCIYINANNITKPLPPIPNGGYLIEGGVGSTRGLMPMSLAGPGSSLVEVAPSGWLKKRGDKDVKYKNVTILPVSDVVNTNVYFFKLDVQGYEFEVLKGAKELFDNYFVKTLLMEVYPRGLGNAGTDFMEFLSFVWNDLGMFCSSANPGGFKVNHPNSIPNFADYLKSLHDDNITKVSWGTFDDFYCFNREKIWIWG